ncbi:MAG: hypothetical protein QME94_07270, partial [Anaerolineae bacterium]|nr:hypothetical protein [Anaerolineae bacterium]
HKPEGRAACCGRASEPIDQWANGLQLLERRLSGKLARADTIELILVWRAARAPGQQVYHFFNHLVHLPDDRLVSQEDGPGVHTPYLREGDCFVTRFLIPIPQDAPAGNYEVRVGIYELQSLERVRLAGGADSLPLVAFDLPAQG